MWSTSSQHLKEVGASMGLEAADLLNFIREQQKIERKERDKEKKQTKKWSERQPKKKKNVYAERKKRKGKKERLCKKKQKDRSSYSKCQAALFLTQIVGRYVYDTCEKTSPRFIFRVRISSLSVLFAVRVVFICRFSPVGHVYSTYALAWPCVRLLVRLLVCVDITVVVCWVVPVFVCLKVCL